jgi:hypothetical protein
MNERDYNNKMNLLYAGDNLPRLIDKIIVGMPIRFSGDEKQLLEITNECVQYEIERRSKLGRKLKKNPSKKTLAQRKWRAKQNEPTDE